MPMTEASPSANRWRTHVAALGVVVALTLLFYRRDATAIAGIWWDSSTYEHCLVILPIVGWLVWQRLPILAAEAPRGWAPALVWTAIGALGWLIGDAAGVSLARHLGLAMMLQGAVATLLGRGATAGLLFPLCYALFLVPAGDGLVPPLQTLTARMCMALLDLAAVPARIDGVFITTPGGWFKVAEACSGAKFLIAMVALGALVAHLGFRSKARQAAFMALCVVVPVLANGVRAFATVWIAQYRGAKSASGIDHVIYGWIFFAIVIALVLAVSWRFFDRPADAVPVDPEAVARAAAKQRTTLPLLPASTLLLAIAAAAPGWSALIQAQSAAPIAASPGAIAIRLAARSISRSRSMRRRARGMSWSDSAMARSILTGRGPGRRTCRRPQTRGPSGSRRPAMSRAPCSAIMSSMIW